MGIFTKILSLLLTSSLVLSSVGCSSTSNGSKNGNADDNKKTVELTISAAASLKEAMAELESLFSEKNPNISLTFNFGASGSLQQQIEQGAPCDLFISAGKKQMTALADKDLLVSDTNKDLVKNRLVLISTDNTEVTSLNDLTTDKVKTIAVGEPSSVPAGKYADEVLENLGIKSEIESKLVFSKDVKEVLAWSTSENADVGFVYLSDALSNDTAKIIETISEDLHSPITYPVAVIKDSKNVDAAKTFEDFLFSDQAQQVFEKYGYNKVQ
ncbi:molybdate ABC transporter substrate-binding protein [Clostridium saudiense]|nr:molybdate ABC transporter substrate-binding protein [Clostridium saudiense]